MQKIVPFLWFDNNAEEAINFYTSLFSESRILEMNKYEKEDPNGNDVFSANFELAGFEFMGLNGGPQFKFNPSISFFVNCKSEAEINELWNKLSDDGQVLMEYQKYPFSEKYGWVEDKYGISWQLSLTKEKTKITPSFMFIHNNFGKAEEAMKFYVDVFYDNGNEESEIKKISRYDSSTGAELEDKINYAEFKLAGVDFKAMENNYDHKFDFNEAISLFVHCKDQQEVDYFWQKLTANGGEESQCGWLKDKYGVSWQIVPNQLGKLMNDPDQEKAERVIQAMLKMQKIDISKLEMAYKGQY